MATERTIYVAVLVVEHGEGVGPTIDHDERRAALGVRSNLVCWLDGVLRDEDAMNDDGTLFYGVRDVTLYSESDFIAELADNGSISDFPEVEQ